MGLKFQSMILLGSLSNVISAMLAQRSVKGNLIWRGKPIQFFWDLVGLLQNPIFLAGMFFFVVANVIWMLVLSNNRIVVLVPMQFGLVLTANPILSYLFLNETLTPTGWFGVLLFLVGVVLISR